MSAVHTGSHIGLWILMVVIGGWLIYSATHSSTENNKFSSGSGSYTVENHYAPLSSLVPCGAFFSISQEKLNKPIKPVTTVEEVKK